jgi:hypothetical protein
MGERSPCGGDPRFDAARLAPEQVDLLGLTGPAGTERGSNPAAVGLERF